MTTPPPAPSLRAQLSPLIRARGISAVAAAAGLHQPTLSAWLAGRRRLPLHQIEALARAVDHVLIVTPTHPTPEVRSVPRHAP
jgi:DNA-binding transcriptional regulator YdaS (Cro superfamily)